MTGLCFNSGQSSLTLATAVPSTTLALAPASQCQPEIFNTDQGIQFSRLRFTGILEDRDIRISMDGRGRAFDNIIVTTLAVSEVRKGLPEGLPDPERSILGSGRAILSSATLKGYTRGLQNASRGIPGI